MFFGTATVVYIIRDQDSENYVLSAPVSKYYPRILFCLNNESLILLVKTLNKRDKLTLYCMETFDVASKYDTDERLK